jgi:hypothetical protein
MLSSFLLNSSNRSLTRCNRETLRTGPSSHWERPERTCVWRRNFLIGFSVDLSSLAISLYFRAFLRADIDGTARPLSCRYPLTTSLGGVTPFCGHHHYLPGTRGCSSPSASNAAGRWNRFAVGRSNMQSCFELSRSGCATMVASIRSHRRTSLGVPKRRSLLSRT